MLTCIAILAVDFRVFPRRFAKTETFGLSLMDVGVGTFIFSSAITSRYAKGITGRGKSSSQSSSTPISAAGGVSNSSSNVYRIVQRLAVLVLGLGRMVVIKTLGYQEHVTEYGVDWNFFVTLFCVWSAADLAHRLLPRWAIPWLASTILLGYQLLLTHFSLTDYILSAPRTGFLSQNREGIFSLCGLLPLYLLSEHLAHKLFFSVHDNSKVNSLDIQDTGSSSPRVRPGNIARLESGRFDASTSAHSSRSSSHSTEDNIPTLLVQPTTLDSTTKAPHTISILGLNWQVLLPRHCRPLARQLSILSGSAWSMWWLTSALIQPASRRLMNLSFILFCLSLCGTLLLLIFLVDSIGPRSSPATSLEYCNSSQLPVFILANLLTGVINMVLPTIFVAPTPAMLTLTIYTAVVVGIAWVLGSRKLS